jgi:predicted regulator of Ras-like GTPase activity (Roadblock/LC7/MglB family)
VFGEHLKQVVDNTEGGVGALLMGFDGIAVEHYLREGGQKFDITTIGMEFSFILTQVKKAGELLKVGQLNEFSVKAESMTMLVRMINDDYFLAVVIGDGGNYGKCRFLMRMAHPRLLAEL